MDLHKRYLHFPTLDVSALQPPSDQPRNVFDIIHNLTEDYNCEIIKETLDKSKLEIYRILLCHEYQLLFNAAQQNRKHKRCTTAQNIPFPTIKAIFAVQHVRRPPEILILRDILILQMVLHRNSELLKPEWEDFLFSSNAYFKSRDARVMYMKILECHLEILQLDRFLYNDANHSEKELETLGLMYVRMIRSWVDTKEDTEWAALVSILPMLTKTFSPQYVFYPLWNYILNEMSDLKNSLTILSVTGDIYFESLLSMDSSYIYQEIYSKDTFWMLMLRGLGSREQQYRKQALYVMKRAIDSMNTICTQDSRLAKAAITPFICKKSNDTDLPVKQKFFLVLEALEEKQYHLIVPALTHVSSLIRTNTEHKSCNECFNIVWLQCIFVKILLHENNNIVKWGVHQVCNLSSLFDDQFLEIFVNVLNQTFLYECHSDDEYPDTAGKLLTFLTCAAQKNFLNKFLEIASRINWGPIAIFYVIYALRRVPHETQHSDWQANELNAVKSLMETNLDRHSHILRRASQIELLRSIPKYVQRIDNLALFANTLAVFPSSESLIRGSTPWVEIALCLEKMIGKTEAIAFVEGVCAKYYITQELACHEISLKTFALMILLLHDANLIMSTATCPSMKALNNWLRILNGIDTRPYANMHLSINAVEFISYMMNLLSNKPEEPSSVKQLISSYVQVGFKLLTRHMRKMVADLFYEDYMKYTLIVSTYVTNADSFMNNANGYIEKLQNESIDLLKHTRHAMTMQCLYGLHVLYLTQQVLDSQTAKVFYSTYLKDVQAKLKNVSADADIANVKGNVTSEYYLLLSRLMCQCTTDFLISENPYGHPLWLPTTMLLDNLVQLLELGGTEVISAIATILTVINNACIIEEETRERLENIFKVCWRHLFASGKNNAFWAALSDLIRVIINDNFLLLPNAVEFMTDYIDELIEQGAAVPRFKRLILSAMKSLRTYSNLLPLKEPLLNCLLHGPVLRRDQKIENQVYVLISKHLSSYYPSYILLLDYHNDAAVRVEAIVLLYKIINNPDLNYAAEIMPLMVDMLEKHKERRYFKDSQLHKLKYRLMQSLLILEPVLNEEVVTMLQEKLCDLLVLESNQHSVKLIQEWLLIRIFSKNVNLHSNLWKLFTETIKNRPGCTTSVASIVYHVARLLSGENQKNFVRVALPYIAQCCLGQQYNVRLYNQFILVRLYELMNQIDGEYIISQYSGMYLAAVASLKDNPKTSIKLEDEFYFSHFHPINDYSLQTIFFELPRLTNVNYDEWITPDLFKVFGFPNESNEHHPLQLYNIDQGLSKIKDSMFLKKSIAGDTNLLANTNVETYMEGLHDIQKKIDPKDTAVLYKEIFEEMKESIYQRDTQLYDKSLIVVASFVSRAPNLGGIARSCEIFGVRTLVVANLDCAKDKEFQSVSVSAEKWINMLQVKPPNLQEYLLEKKNAGWSIIGAEQTANSMNLLDTKFKKNTVLVLGHEKDGIPANFIPLFDTCVEIPQVGVIRSLNVHVTAAICIWQYVSQYMVK